MGKKLTIVGKGTVGCLSLAQFLSRTEYEIDWVFDHSVSTTSVGEGTTMTPPKVMSSSLGWSSADLMRLGGTPKQGILKTDWGNSKEFFHPFPLGSTGIHLSALKFQEAVYSQLKDNPRVSVRDDNIGSANDVDSDFVLMCTGSPVGTEDYIELTGVPVNACYVTQCYWDNPEFDYTLTLAMPHGWVFGIPLKERCAIGYMYNSDITSLDEVKADVQAVFDRYCLKPSDTTNHLKFSSYRRANNFDGRCVYNGNASFFLEPLEATSTTNSCSIVSMAMNYWCDGNSDKYNGLYVDEVESVETMIAMHYASGSSFNTDFWDFANERCSKRLEELFKKETSFAKLCYASLKGIPTGVVEAGTWGAKSCRLNATKLGINDTILSLGDKFIANSEGIH